MDLNTTFRSLSTSAAAVFFMILGATAMAFQPYNEQQDYCGPKQVTFGNRTVVPRGVTPGVSFNHPCYGHDRCYGDCKTLKKSKDTCDTDFRNEMRTECASVRNIGPKYAECMAAADSYYQAVKNGAAFFHAYGCKPNDLISTGTNQPDPDQPQCAFTLTPPQKTYSAAQATDGFSVGSMKKTSRAIVLDKIGCYFLGRSTVAWITVTQPTPSPNSIQITPGGRPSYHNTGTIQFSLQPNPSFNRRTANVVVDETSSAGITTRSQVSSFTVTQEGCGFRLNKLGEILSLSGGSGSVSFTADLPQCPWSASTRDNWITITSPRSGTGPGTLNYSVAHHTGTQNRQGYVTIGNVTFTITQYPRGGSSTNKPRPQ